MEERDFFIEARAQRDAVLQCSFCRATNDYSLTWMVRKKRTNINVDRLDARDRARFEKAASYMVLLDDMVVCANPVCRRRFEISGVKTMAFVTPEQLEEVQFAPEGRGGQGQQQRAGYGQQRGQDQHRGQTRLRQGPRQGQGAGQPSGGGGRGPRDDNFGNRVDDDRHPGQRGGYGQQGTGQQRFGEGRPARQGARGAPANRQGGHGPRNPQTPRQDEAQPLRSPRGKRSDPTGPGGGWR